MIMRKIRSNKGFSLVEALFVVAIIVVLGTVIIMSIVDHMRSLEKTENDGYAKTIFIAAQNHLTMADHEGFLGRTKFGNEDEENTGVYYYRVDNHVNEFNDKESVLDLILPFGSLDETVRSGCYIVRYQKSSAKVLDVFYWKSEGRYSYDYQDGDYRQLLNVVKSDPDKLRNYDGAVIGYYGGAQIEEEPGRKLDPPQIQVTNAETLSVKVTKTIESTDEKIILAVRGETSGVLKQLTLYNDGDGGKGYYEILLDSITGLETNHHFFKINTESGWNGDGELIPGENISIYAVAYNSAVYSNVAFSSTQVTNSLFAEGNTASLGVLPDQITISNIRHLENLDARISKYGAAADATINAEQTVNLDWIEFANAVDDVDPCKVRVFDKDAASSTPAYSGDGVEFTGGYEPISPSYTLFYDGKNHTISNVTINVTGDHSAAGLLGDPTGAMHITNLRLQDFRVSGSEAGTLAANLVQSEVRNVLACQSKEATRDANVLASSGNAGGLVGTADGTYFEACAAAVYVNSATQNAGGLVGQTKNSGLITGCYSAGYTEGGDYYKPAEDGLSTPIYSVRAGTNAGGLVGDCSTKITYSYSTCSVMGEEVAGGLVGVTGKVIEDSYCTGLVGGTTGTTKGAFVGQLRVDTPAAGEGHENYYFSIINYGIGAVGLVGQDADASRIYAFDRSTKTYRMFVSTGADGDERTPANPYDDTLVAYYQGGFNLRTVKQLGYVNNNFEGSYDALETKDFVDAHYGDWPAPEILIVNVPN